MAMPPMPGWLPDALLAMSDLLKIIAHLLRR